MKTADAQTGILNRLGGRKAWSAAIFALVAASLLSACSLVNPNSSNSLANSSSADSLGSGAASESSSVPTADAVVGRIQKGLTLPGSSTSLVSSASGNFQKVLSQLQTNLPYTTDPSAATGLDQIPLLVYAACADVNPSSYSVSTGQSVSSQMTNLVNAGVTMVNQHVGNLAASGTQANQQVQAVFTQLINQDASAGASTATTFISVCLAANSFGVGMTGF